MGALWPPNRTEHLAQASCCSAGTIQTMLQYASPRAVPVCLAACPGSSSGLAGQLWEDSQGPWPSIPPAGYLCNVSQCRPVSGNTGSPYS